MVYGYSAQPSGLENALIFFDKLGIFSIVLPFLLVFTIVFAILEKTKIYGTEKFIKGDKTVEFPRKNLNAMTAFVMAFFVVASSQLVAIISTTLSWTVLVLVLILAFMMLAGSFHTGKEEFVLQDNWKKIFMVIAFLAIILIFLHATGLLPWLYGYILWNWNGTIVSAIGLIIMVVVFIAYVTKVPSSGGKKSEG
ncbi:MAG: hypothetical protein ABIH41_04200 [Nanoarchaeota archaeon]